MCSVIRFSAMTYSLHDGIGFYSVGFGAPVGLCKERANSSFLFLSFSFFCFPETGRVSYCVLAPSMCAYIEKEKNRNPFCNSYNDKTKSILAPHVERNVETLKKGIDCENSVGFLQRLKIVYENEGCAALRLRYPWLTKGGHDGIGFIRYVSSLSSLSLVFFFFSFIYRLHICPFWFMHFAIPT